MFGEPVVAHVSQLVLNLAARDARERDDEGAEKWRDENSDNSDDSLEQNAATTSLKEETLKDSKLSQRKPKRVYHVGPGKGQKWWKTRRWRESSALHHGLKSEMKGSKVARKYGHKITESSISPRNLGGADPFGAFELPQNSSTERALHHWVTVFQETRMPMTPRKAWMRINLSDKTLLSVTTFCSTYHFYFVRGVRPPPNCLSQKQLAIRNINDSLMKQKTVPSDYLMVAVAVMTILEGLAGELNACAIHRKGLQLMVQARGGIQKLGLDGGAQRTISWADTSTAILLRTKPSLSPLLTNYVGESPTTGFHIGDLVDRLAPLTTSPDITKIILYIWLRLRYLSEFLARESDKDIDSSLFSDKIDFVERQCLSLLHSPSLSSAAALAFLIAFLNASFIFIYAELRECPKGNNLLLACSERIYSGLMMLDLEDIGDRCPDLLMWVLVLGKSGVIPIREPPSRMWYAETIAELGKKYLVEVPRKMSGMGYFELAERMARRGPGDVNNVQCSSTYDAC